ncbi:MFS transporter [Lactobacillus kalixensis]|nr:MFS transporter [Lactobacillus kalixensis]
MNVFLKNKDFRRFSVASFLSGAGDVLFYLAFMTYASKLQNYSLALSLIAISESVPKLFEIFGGYFADKTQNKFRNIFLCAIIRFVLYSLVGLLFVVNVSQWNLVLIIIGINFISDTVGSYSGGLVSPLIVDVVGEKEFGEAAGFNSGINQIINMGAQFIGAGLLLVMSYASLAFLNAGTFLLAGILYASVGFKHRKQQKPLETNQVNDQKFFATMKTSFNQVKKQKGLLTVVLVIALLNGSLGVIEPLTNIVLAAHKSTMVIGTYSFTIALMSVMSGAGFALGSMFGPQLFKKASVFSMTIVANILGIIMTGCVLSANTYAIFIAMFFLSATAGIASIKMSQWLVSSVDHKILATSMGMLNTILMAVGPVMTTVLTTISGTMNVYIALVILVAIEVVTLVGSVVVSFRIKGNEESKGKDKKAVVAE